MNTSKKCIVALTILGLALPASACAPSANPLESQASSDGIVVSSANFSENVLLGEIYAQALEAQGLKVTRKLNVGSREVLYQQLQSCSLDVVPEYNQALLAYVAPTVKAVGSAEVTQKLKDALPESLGILTPSPAEDNNGVAVTSKMAAKYNLKSIPDLAARAPELVMGGPTEWQKRADGLVGLKETYGITFKEYRVLGDNSGPITVSALDKGDVDVALMQTSSPYVKLNDFTVLKDPATVVGVNNVTPLICKKNVNSKAAAALEAVSAAMTTEELIEINKAYSIDKQDAPQIAETWLKQNSLKG